MKTIYSLKEFHEKAVQISGEEGKHISVMAEYGLFHKLEFNCYSAKLNKFFRGSTMEEVLSALKEAIHPSPRPNIDVEIDIEAMEKFVESI